MREKSNLAEKPIDDEQVASQVLAIAFRQFSEASAKLEERYATLRTEVETLRSQLREKDLAMKRSEKLATLGEAAAAIAHEVRNPLGAIKLCISLLKEDVADRPEALDLAEQIDRSINSLDGVVSNILQFSKHKKLSMGPVNINSLIREQLALLMPRATGQARATLDLSGAPYLNGNEHTLRQVFYNLFLNAMQTTKQCGTLDIRSFSPKNGGLVVLVKDDGPGIAPAIMDRLFEPFVTTRNEGTGLGLAIVKQILDQHNAKISVRNDQGAEFRIEFPALGCD